jgi:ribosomal protein L24
MIKLKNKTGDIVRVIETKGAEGILRVDREKTKVVEGVNMVSKHTKCKSPSRWYCKERSCYSNI